jgi:transposase InsO family protein
MRSKTLEADDLRNVVGPATANRYVPQAYAVRSGAEHASRLPVPVAMMDWFSRKVLAWRLSSTMDAEFCVTALEEATARFSRPEIFNTDQGSQFTSFAFTNNLKDAGIRISMDGPGRWMDNVFIERLWRSLKYECVYLNAFETGNEARTGIARGIRNNISVKM